MISRSSFSVCSWLALMAARFYLMSCLFLRPGWISNMGLTIVFSLDFYCLSRTLLEVLAFGRGLMNKCSGSISV